MKGIIIQKNIQYSCELEGESWRQGDSIKGTLETSDSSGSGRIVLATATPKKVKEKDPKAFTLLENRDFKATLEGSPKFELILPQDCPLTGVYLLYGEGEDLLELGNLPLSISPNEIIEKFLETFNLFFKFKTKSLKSNKKGFLDAKVAVPSSKEFSNMISLNLSLKMDGENFLLLYQFIVNKMTYADGDAKLVKEKVLFERTLTPKDYLIYGSSFNQEEIVKSISEVLEKIKKNRQFER